MKKLFILISIVLSFATAGAFAEAVTDPIVAPAAPTQNTSLKSGKQKHHKHKKHAKHHKKSGEHHKQPEGQSVEAK